MAGPIRTLTGTGANSPSSGTKGATVTRTAQGDDDANDGATAIDIWVERLEYGSYTPCECVWSDKPQCEQVGTMPGPNGRMSDTMGPASW